MYVTKWTFMNWKKELHLNKYSQYNYNQCRSETSEES
jgi:hypothetical protein